MVYRYYFTEVLRPKASVLGSLMAEILEAGGPAAFRGAHRVYDAWRAGKITYPEALRQLKAILKEVRK